MSATTTVHTARCHGEILHHVFTVLPVILPHMLFTEAPVLHPSREEKKNTKGGCPIAESQIAY